MDFLSEKDRILGREFIEQGYIIRSVADKVALNKIQKFILSKLPEGSDNSLDKVHQNVDIDELNTFRLKIIQEINEQHWLREAYYQVAKPYLDVLVGNELAMQLKVNLSIQMPGDKSSLLPIHADTWSGDSPYEVVVWLPLVDCHDTKSMYFLPPKEANNLSDNFQSYTKESSEQIFLSIKDKVKWMKVNYGQVLVFNQIYPHGNRVNEENESRWSMNCRFKSLFSPYKDKKIGEFFEPITMRPVTKVAISYKLPIIK